MMVFGNLGFFLSESGFSGLKDVEDAIAKFPDSQKNSLKLSYLRVLRGSFS